MALTLGSGALARVDLVIAQGASNRYAFRYLTGEYPVPVDLTGWTIRAQMRRSTSAADAWITVTGTGDNDGNVVLQISHTQTEGSEWDARDAGVWDLELTSPAGDRVRLVEGVVRVSHEVTRDA